LPSNRPLSSGREIVEKITHWILGILIALSSLFFWVRQAPFAAGADASGYMSFSRLLSEGTLTLSPLTMGFSKANITDRRLYEPLGYTYPNDEPILVPIYPSGFPLLTAAFIPMLGQENAVSTVMFLAFIGCGFMTFLLGRHLGLSPPYALLAAITMTGSPLTIFMGLIPMTDVLSTTLLTLTCILATRVHRKTGWGFLLGFVLALAILVRPTNALVFLALPFLVGRKAGWRPWPAIAVGGTPGLVWVLFLNTTLYGHPLATGYGDILPLLGSENLAANLRHFAIWLTILFTPLLTWPFLGRPLLGRAFRKRILPLALWAAPFLVFFSFYSFSSRDWWFTRFLLPAMPAIVTGSALVWQEVARRWFRPRVIPWMPWALIGSVAISHFITVNRKGADDIRKGHIVYREAGAWIDRNTTEGDGILCLQFSGSLRYYTDNRPILRYDFLDRESWDSIVSTARSNRVGIYAVLDFLETERGEALEIRAPGDWREVAHLRYATLFKLRDTLSHSSRSLPPDARSAGLPNDPVPSTDSP